MANFLLILICLSTGVLLQRLKIFPKDAPLTLNLYVIWVALPALILLQVPQLSYSSDLLIAVLMPWLMLLLGASLVLAGARYFRWPKAVTGALLLTVPLGNTSFLGVPMIAIFFGQEMTPYGIIYDQLGSFLILSTYGTVVLSLYSGRERKTTVVIVKGIVTFPPFVWLCISLLIGRYIQTAAISHVLQILADSLVPVVMVAIGLQLNIRLSKAYLQPFLYGLLVKMIIPPFLALALCKFIGLNTPAAVISIFEAGMPPMITPGVLAMAAGLAPELVVALIGYGIILSFVTLPLLAGML